MNKKLFLLSISIVIPSIVLFFFRIDLIGLIFKPCYLVLDATKTLPNNCALIETIFKIGDFIIFLIGIIFLLISLKDK